MKSLSRVRLLATPWTAAYQAPLLMGFSRQEYWSGLPLLSSHKTLSKMEPQPGSECWSVPYWLAKSCYFTVSLTWGRKVWDAELPFLYTHGLCPAGDPSCSQDLGRASWGGHTRQALNTGCSSQLRSEGGILVGSGRTPGGRRWRMGRGKGQVFPGGSDLDRRGSWVRTGRTQGARLRQ